MVATVAVIALTVPEGDVPDPFDVIFRAVVRSIATGVIIGFLQPRPGLRLGDVAAARKALRVDYAALAAGLIVLLVGVSLWRRPARDRWRRA